jgi:hypothetical protein
MGAPPSRRRRRYDHRDRRLRLKLARERAAQSSTAKACGAGAENDQIRAFFGCDLRKCLGALAEHNPLLRSVPDVSRDHVECLLASAMALARSQTFLRPLRHAVDDVHEHKPQTEPRAESASDLGCAPPIG